MVDGAKICALAKEKHGTVKAFALSLGCLPNTISNLRQARPTHVKFAEKIAAALGVTLSEITLSASSGEEQDDKPEQEADAA